MVGVCFSLLEHAFWVPGFFLDPGKGYVTPTHTFENIRTQNERLAKEKKNQPA
jgi:hypothetical protein